MSIFLVACGAPQEASLVGNPTDRGAGTQPEAAGGDSYESTYTGLRGFLELSRGEKILERTLRVEVRASADTLSSNERAVLTELETVGEIFHRLYEDSCHANARAVRAHLESYQPANDDERRQLEMLRDLYALFRGPAARGLENERVPLAPDDAYRPGRNIYPSGVSADVLQRYAKAHPSAGILDVRSIVRRRSAEALSRDREVLRRYPALVPLLPQFVALVQDRPEASGFYGVPYSVAYAEEMFEASERLHRASALVREDDSALADFLEQRGRDLLTSDYEAGDAVWVSGRTRRINAQIGAYETYDDHLMGIRAFYSLSILIRDPEASAELERAVEHLPELQSSLPGGPYDRVRSRIPIGIYDVWADYGQARGANTATILPNEPHITRRYGRTILIRRNILANPALVELSQRRFRAVVASAHRDDLGPRGAVDRTVFHEVGHYLGPTETSDGRPISEALGSLQNLFEELKSDLLALWLLPRLVELGVLTEERRRSAYASGVLRVLPIVRPRETQPYQMMQLMQQRYYLDRELLRYDSEAGVLHVDYDRFHEVVEAMLSEVLAIQRRGDRAEAQAFVQRWARWDADSQGVIGGRIDRAGPRYRLVSYPQLER